MNDTAKQPQLDSLRRELGGKLPEGLDALDTLQLRALTEKLRTAKQRQQLQVEKSLESALSHLPALLRGAVRKLFDA